MKRRSDSDTDSEPSAKRQKTTHSKPNAPPIPFTPDEVKQLLRIFSHLESQKTQNHTLDRCIYDSYKSYSHTLNAEQPPKTDANPSANTDALDSQIRDIVVSKTIFPSNVFIEQLIQLKAQIKAIRLLSRDIGLSSTLSDIAHGIDNPHSWQRPFIDPLRTQNPCVCKHSKYNLDAAKTAQPEQDEQIIVDNSPQTVEHLVYQHQFDAHKKLVHRRRMLKDYVSHCDAAKTAKRNRNSKGKQHAANYDVSAYHKSRDELQLLELYELQQKVRNEVVQSRLDKYVYDCDNGEHEALLDPDLFARTGQVGLHFDPHINSANHPPTMATSSDIFPFYYQGRK